MITTTNYSELVKNIDINQLTEGIKRGYEAIKKFSKDYTDWGFYNKSDQYKKIVDDYFKEIEKHIPEQTQAAPAVTKPEKKEPQVISTSFKEGNIVQWGSSAVEIVKLGRTKAEVKDGKGNHYNTKITSLKPASQEKINEFIETFYNKEYWNTKPQYKPSAIPEPPKPTKKEFSEFYADVVYNMELQAELTTSDAQGIITPEIENWMRQKYEAGKTNAVAMAKVILKKSFKKPEQPAEPVPPEPPVKPAKQKAVKVAKQKKQKPEKVIQPDKATYVENIDPSVKFIQRFVGMDGKTKTKEQILAFINAIQRGITTKQVSVKTGPYAPEIKFMQTTLIDILNTMRKPTKIEISADRYRTLKDYADSEKMMLAVVYIKQFIGIQGKDDMKEKAAKLLKRIKKARETGKIPDNSKYIDKVNDMVIHLTEVANNKAKRLTVEENELNGFKTICACNGWPSDTWEKAKSKIRRIFHEKRPRIEKPTVAAIPPKKHPLGAINSMELKNQTFQTLGMQGKFRELLGDPAEPFICMIYGGAGSGKTTLAIELAHTLAADHNRKVAYVSKEERLGATLQEKFSRLDAYHENIMLFPDQLPKNMAEFNYVIIDSINEMKLTIDDMKRIVKENPTVSFVILFKATKDGNFKGTNDWEHFAEIVIACSEGIARPEKSRFGGKGVVKIYNIDESIIAKFNELPKAEAYKAKQREMMNIIKGADGKYWVVRPAYAELMKQQGFEILL